MDKVKALSGALLLIIIGVHIVNTKLGRFSFKTKRAVICCYRTVKYMSA